MNLCISMHVSKNLMFYVWTMYQFLCVGPYVPCICSVVSMISHIFSLWSTFYVSYQFCCVSVSIVYQFCYLHTVSANLVYTCPRNLVHTGFVLSTQVLQI
jgi:hypothetical protein